MHYGFEVLRSLVLGVGLALAACSQGPYSSDDLGTRGAGTQATDGAPSPDDRCTPATTVDPLSVSTTRGVVRGMEAGTTVAFLGIPYAAPPVGSLRFAQPVEHACWSDVKAATRFGSQCMQVDPATQQPVGDENCLFLNVWTPTLDATAALPVLFWVHGGADIVGAGDQRLSAAGSNLYDGQKLADREHAVVVTMNYRLGALGFLANALLDAEDAHGASGDYAIGDQLLALRWVQKNITHFGGDTKRVMLFGESAGAMNTCVLLTSPLSKGLFSRALMESGDCSAKPRTEAESIGAAIATKLGCSDVACLRQTPASQIALQTPVSLPIDGSTNLKEGLSGTLQFAASVNGYTVTDDPMKLLTSSHYEKVPLLIGTNAQEMALFLVSITTFTCSRYETDMMMLFGAGAPSVIGAYPCNLDGRAAEVAALTDLAMSCPAQRIALASSANGAATYRYHFTHTADYGPTVGLGAYHAAELPYVFDTFAAEGYFPTPGEQGLSDLMKDAWGHFATDATPGGTWPTYSEGDRKWMQLDSTSAVADDSLTAKCAVWAQVMGW